MKPQNTLWVISFFRFNISRIIESNFMDIDSQTIRTTSDRFCVIGKLLFGPVVMAFTTINQVTIETLHDGTTMRTYPLPMHSLDLDHSLSPVKFSKYLVVKNNSITAENIKSIIFN